jgi:LacI family transcriptional regulator
LGYRPNILARSLRSKRNHTIGVIVFDLTDPYCTLVLRGIEGALHQAAYVPILTDAHNERTRFERCLEMLLDRRVEGLIVIANWLFVDVNLLADLEKRSIPTAIIGRELQSGAISSVLVDNEAGGRMALEHLHKLGHRKIAFIRGPKMLGDTGSRWRGIREFARAHELEIDPELVLELPDAVDPKSAFENGQRLTEELLKRKHRFTALMAFDDMTALGAVRALEQAGVKVPEDCSVIGFDDVGPAAVSAPPLTTVRQPMEAMGATAVSIIMSGISAAVEQMAFKSSRHKMAPELVVRESTRLKERA